MAQSGSNAVFANFYAVPLMLIVSIVLLVLAGVLSAALTDVFAVTLLSVLPATVDLSSNWFLYCVLPGSIAAGLIVGLVFGRIMRRVSLPIGLIYVVTYVGLQFLLLTELKNPMGDRLSYMGIALAVSLLILFWRRGGIEGAKQNRPE